MKRLLLRILKGVLIISVVLILLALTFGLVLWLGWPWWVGIFILIGLVGIFVGVVFLKKLLQRQREQHFVQQVIQEEAAYTAAMADKDRERSRDLQNRWKEAIDALRGSHLKKMGNPLYVLPWYLVIGESGAGKTTGIKSARLSSPFAEISRISGISGTRNCDWWFFEQAVILDTAGRYAIPVDEGRDKEEWQKFLGLLAKFRKREPLNGLVITIAADKLLSADPEILEADGRSLRLRIDELMRILGAKFPVYVLVTKCDLIQGMTQFCEGLPEAALDQAMGVLNHDLSTDILSFHERATHTMVERLKDLRLQLVHRPAGAKAAPELLLFPEEFERLREGLAAFTRGAFQENPYQETPILRGLFFSSGRQEGSPYSHFLKSLGLIEEREMLPGSSKGMFLFDFFSRILPADRRLFAPTLRAIEWSRLTRNLGLTAWVAITIALCGLLSFSFVKNLRTLREVSQEFASPPVLQGDMVQDVILMDRFRQTILQLGDRNRSWWIPRFGLDESVTVEDRLKAVFTRQFQGSLLSPLDKQMTERMTGFTDQTPDLVLAYHVVHLVRRINLLKARLAGDDLAALKGKPQPAYEVYTPDAAHPLLPELRDRLEHLYLYDLIWRKDRNGINQEINTLQTWLKHLLALKGTDLGYLVAWANTASSIQAVSLADFWNSHEAMPEPVRIEPAYTLKGKQLLDQFFKEMDAALFDPLVVAKGKLEFQNRYRQQYLDAWETFARKFSEGRSSLSNPSDRQSLIARVGEGQGPYFTFLNRITEELAPYRDTPERPWIHLAYAFEAARTEAARRATLSKTGILSKAAQKGKNLLEKVEKRVGKPEDAKFMESRLTAAVAAGDYQRTLTALAKAVTSRKGAFDAATAAFSEEAAGGATEATPSLFMASQGAISTLETAFQNTDAEPFWRLVAGPQQLLLEVACKESACHLEGLWENTVLMDIQGLRGRKEINDVALGQSGPVTALISGPAAPFIDRNLKKGYFARTLLGQQIPFTDAFFTYLTKGTRAVKPAGVPAAAASQWTVTIKALPTDVNQDALIRPHATQLDVTCGGKVSHLINLNYPVRKRFNWSPGTCEDTTFSIDVGRLTLTRKYTGSLGFARFLAEFNPGKKRFYPKDFPGQEDSLKRMRIKYIQINYQFSGQAPVVDYYRKSRAVPAVPREIASCWDH